MSSGSISYNPFYEPVVTERFFSRRRKYDEVEADRNNLAKMVDAFEERIRNWYIEPAELLLERGVNKFIRKIVRCLTGRQSGGHYAFTVASITCLLIDALSQFRYGELTSDGRIFRQFVTSDLRSYNITLSTNIWHFDDRHAPTGKELKTVSEVIWSGIRCGFLHQAHAPLYCGIVPGCSIPSIVTGHAKYGSRGSRIPPGTDCPVVIVEPEHLFGEVVTFFESYLKNLKRNESKYELLRDNFKKKFSDSFGIDITTSTL
jgi:hypothetical protein